MAQRPGQVMSKVQLLTRVWGFDHLDINLVEVEVEVEVQVSSLRRKLGTGYVLRG